MWALWGCLMTQTYKAPLLIVNEDLQIVLQKTQSGWKLPQVDVSPGRIGIMLSRAVREQLHLDIFSLVLPRTTASQYHVVRLHGTEKDLPIGFAWCDAGERETEQVTAILSSVNTTEPDFGSYAWYTQTTKWIGDTLGNMGYSVHRFEQWNGRIGGVLLQVFTDGPSFWFKAVSDFNEREFGISKLLADRHPQFFPRIVASESRWRAFLVQHIDGIELHAVPNLDIWRTVARSLAEIQLDWMGDSEILLASGAADLRPSALVDKLPGFLAHIASTMERQPATTPAVLSASDLSLLNRMAEELCLATADLPFSEDWRTQTSALTMH